MLYNFLYLKQHVQTLYGKSSKGDLCMKKFLSCLLVILTILISISFAEDLTTDEAYWENIELLSIYMRADPEAPVDIAALCAGFQDLHHYQFSTEFSLYSQILKHLEQNDFNNAASWLSVLQLYPEFDKYVADKEFSAKYPEIRGLTEMATYINGRREEAAYNYNEASTYYKSCLKFFDSMNRYRNLFVDLNVVVEETLDQIKNGDYSNALKNAEYLITNNHEQGQALYTVAKAQLDAAMATPIPTPTPTAAPPEWSAWSSWSTTEVAANSTTQVEQKTQYRSRTIAQSQDYTSWGSWSDWSTTSVSENSTRDVETRKQYRYRDTTYKTEYSYGSWSDWSTTAVSSSSTREVETKQVNQTTTTKVYTYSRWRYYNTSANAYWHSYAKYTGSEYKAGSGEWQYKTTTTPLAKDGVVDGQQRYKGIWWNQKVETKETTTTVTMYRYRTRTEKQVASTGSWSSWSTKSVSSSSTRQVETRTQYRYRTRSLKTTTTKADWSAWSDNKINASSTLEVETQTLYRYRTLQGEAAVGINIIKQPTNATAQVGSIVRTTVEATGNGLSYTWYLKNPASTTFGKSSITGDTYSFTMTKESSGRMVYCVITDADGNTVTTNVVTLSIP